jgi:hypothetical protein
MPNPLLKKVDCVISYASDPITDEQGHVIGNEPPVRSLEK